MTLCGMPLELFRFASRIISRVSRGIRERLMRNRVLRHFPPHNRIRTNVCKQRDRQREKERRSKRETKILFCHHHHRNNFSLLNSKTNASCSIETELRKFICSRLRDVESGETRERFAWTDFSSRTYSVVVFVRRRRRSA